MLNLLRRGVKTWVAKVLFALLVASFAIWGIGDVFSFGLGSSVATVGDQKVSAERFANSLNRETRAASQRFGQPLDTEMIRALGLPQQVLARLAQEATLDQAMTELAVSAPDEAVRDAITGDPSFSGPDGGFNESNYRYTLAQSGFTVEEYEEVARRTIARRELVLAITDGAVAPKGAVDALYAYRTETRRFESITLDESFAGEIGEPDQAALEAYHAANEAQFTAPERRDAVYLHLALDALGDDYEPEEDALRGLYARRAADFDRPERRELHQIVYDTREEAEAAATRIENGETIFDGLLAARGETRADASLGMVAADEVASAAGEAAFALDGPGVAGPVDTGFGFALIEVGSIAPAETTPFEDVREELADELRREHALDRAPEVAGEVADRRAAGATLEEIAKELNLPLGEAEGVAQSGEGAVGFEASGEFLTELFAAEEGEERDMVETEAGTYFVLRVTAVEPAALRPLDEVREQAVAGWRAQEIEAALAAEAETIVERIEAGEEIAAIATELGVEPAVAGPATRDGAWPGLPAPLVEELFTLPVGDAGFAPANGSVVISKVIGISEGEATAENMAMRDALEKQMNDMAANDALALFIAAKQQEVGVSVNQQVIDSLLSQTTGY